MKPATIKFDILGLTSFAFKHIYNRTYVTYAKKLKITFPSGEELLFSETDSTYISQLNAQSIEDTKVLADLDELGYSTSIGSPEVVVDIETLKQDLKLYPTMFTKGGETVNFTYETFPDGVYKVEFTYNEKVASNSDRYLSIKSDKESTTQTEPYGTTMYYMYMENSLKCRAAKIEKFFLGGCNETDSTPEKDTLRANVVKMILLETGARWDYSQKEYSKASQKIAAMQVLCAKGKCNYNSNC